MNFPPVYAPMAPLPSRVREVPRPVDALASIARVRNDLLGAEDQRETGDSVDAMVQLRIEADGGGISVGVYDPNGTRLHVLRAAQVLEAADHIHALQSDERGGSAMRVLQGAQAQTATTPPVDGD